MRCPVCARPMLLVEHRDIEVDWCPDCGGCWLDRGELELMLAAVGADPGSLLPREERRSPLKSPKTGRAMRRGHFEGIPVELDFCPLTGGLWFDGGELRDVLLRLGGHAAAHALAAFFGDLLGAAPAKPIEPLP